MAIVIPVDTDTSAAESSLDRLKRHAKEAADKVKGSFKGTADGFEDLGDAVGLPVDKIKKLSGAMSLLATPAGAVGIAVAAVAVSLAAAGIAAVGFVSGVVSLTESAAAALPKLQALSEASGVALVSEEASASINAAKASLDAMGASVSAVGASLASQFAPYVEQAATLVTSVVLALKSWLDANPNFISGVMKVGEVLVNSFFLPLRAIVFSLGGLLESTGMLSEMLGLDFAKKLRDTGKAMVEWSIAGPVAGTVDLLKTATAGYSKEAGNLVNGQKKLNAETAKVAKSVDTLTKMEEEAVKVAEATGAAYRKSVKGLESLTQSARESTATEEERAAAARDSAMAQADAYARSALAAADGSAEVERIEQALADARLAIQNEYESALDKLREDRVQKEADAAQKEADAAAKAAQDKIDQINSAFETASSADSALSAVAAAGPWGAFIAGLISFIKDFDESLKSFSDFHMDFTKTLGELPEILMKHLRDTLAESSVAAVEMASKFMTSLAENIGPILDALTGAMPDIAVAFLQSVVNPMMWARAGYEFVTGVWGSTLRVVARFTGAVDAWWKTFVSGEWAAALKDGAKALKDGIVEGVQAIVDRIKEAFKDLFTIDGGSSSGGGGGSKAKDFLAEVFSLGTKVTKTYGDTPGVVTAGPGGLSARFAPRDKVVASRTDEGLLTQVLNRVGPTSTSGLTQAAPVVNFAYGHRAFDPFFVRHAQLGGRTSQYLKFQGGR